MKSRQQKAVKPPLRVADLMCGRCKVQPTGSLDRVCGICKALGQSVEPEEVSWREHFLAAKPSKLIIRWLESHHWLGLEELKRSLPNAS